MFCWYNNPHRLTDEAKICLILFLAVSVCMSPCCSSREDSSSIPGARRRSGDYGPNGRNKLSLFAPLSTRLCWKAVPRFGEFFYYSCLPLLQYSRNLGITFWPSPVSLSLSVCNLHAWRGRGDLHIPNFPHFASILSLKTGRSCFSGARLAPSRHRMQMEHVFSGFARISPILHSY